jgi:hypothetical protein
LAPPELLSADGPPLPPVRWPATPVEPPPLAVLAPAEPALAEPVVVAFAALPVPSLEQDCVACAPLVVALPVVHERPLPAALLDRLRGLIETLFLSPESEVADCDEGWRLDTPPVWVELLLGLETSVLLCVAELLAFCDWLWTHEKLASPEDWPLRLIVTHWPNAGAAPESPPAARPATVDAATSARVTPRIRRAGARPASWPGTAPVPRATGTTRFISCSAPP